MYTHSRHIPQWYTGITAKQLGTQNDLAQQKFIIINFLCNLKM